MRHLLITGLFLSLGFSLSMNPATLRSGERALASESDQPGALKSFDLEKIDPAQKGLKVFYEIDKEGSERKVRYYVDRTEGTNTSICSDCLGLGLTHSEPLKDQNVQNVELLNRMIAEMAISKITRKPKEESKEVAKEIKETKKKVSETVTSACEDEEEVKLSAEDKALLKMSSQDGSSDLDARLTCKAEEFQALNEECSETLEASTSGLSKAELKTSLAARRACVVKIATYYNKFLKKDLAEGLSSKASAEQNSMTATFRDSILKGLPSQLGGLKNDIMKVSQSGLLDRAKVYYLNRMANKSPNETPQSIATEGKLKMVQELHSSQNANFCSAFSGLSAESCFAANTNPASRAAFSSQYSAYNVYNQNYLSPIEKFAIAQSSGEADFDKMVSQLGLGNVVGNVGTGMIDPNLTGGMPAPEGVYGARTGIQVRGGSNTLLPAPGTVNGSQGQILVPQTTIQQQVQYQQPSIQQAPAIGTATVGTNYPTTQGQLGPRNLPAPVAPVGPTAQPIFQQQQFPTMPTAIQGMRR